MDEKVKRYGLYLRTKEECISTKKIYDKKIPLIQKQYDMDVKYPGKFKYDLKEIHPELSEKEIDDEYNEHIKNLNEKLWRLHDQQEALDIRIAELI